MKKKSYNPFKMWGSYVGVSLGVYFVLLHLVRYGNTLQIIFKDLWFFIPIGFLFGWGIHSLFRSYKK